jgi:hypothetical protein
MSVLVIEIFQKRKMTLQRLRFTFSLIRNGLAFSSVRKLEVRPEAQTKHQAPFPGTGRPPEPYLLANASPLANAALDQSAGRQGWIFSSIYDHVYAL